MLSKGSKAPSFDLLTLSGEPRLLADLLAAGPITLVFFKMSCPTCQLTLPFVDRLACAGGRIIAISQETTANTRLFNQRFGIGMEMLVDGSGYPASNAYGVEHVPSFFQVSEAGEIVNSFSGFVKTEMEELGRHFEMKTFREGEKVPALKPG